MKESQSRSFIFHDIAPMPTTTRTSTKPAKALLENNFGVKPVKPAVAPQSDSETKLVYKKAEAKTPVIFYSQLGTASLAPSPVSRLQRPRAVSIQVDAPDDNQTGRAPDIVINWLSSQLAKAGPWLTTTVTRFRQTAAGLASRTRSLVAGRPEYSVRRPSKGRLSQTIGTLLLLATAAGLIYGFYWAIDQARQPVSPAVQGPTDAEWRQANQQWNCALARYEAEQNNLPLDEDMEKACANIN